MIIIIIIIMPLWQAPDDNGKEKLTLIRQRSWNTFLLRGGGGIERKEKDKKREARGTAS